MEISPSSSCPYQEDSFVWDENYQLYYHARSGFYHDPGAGWYYNSRDGLYYSFCSGQYVLLDANNQGDQCENFGAELEPSSTAQAQVGSLVAPAHFDHVGAASSMVEDEHKSRGEAETEDIMVDSEAPDIPPPTSEWLEDTLIDLFLSSNSARVAGFVDNEKRHMETKNGEDACYVEQEELSLEEENWRAQYGQVVHHNEEEPLEDFKVTDLWDWGIIQEPKTKNSLITRLLGRLVQPSTKVHPSMPSGGKRVKTSPIYRVHLDLVQVKSGQLYRLRSPSVSYLESLSLYDSSNPTKDWGFPELSSKTLPLQSSEPRTSACMIECGNASRNGKFDNNTSEYRDRAAERRALHGAFSFGPGQRTSIVEASSPPPTSLSSEEAAAEALQMSLGPASYAQRILKNMGWKEGDALGKTSQGLTSPLRVVGNKGNAGLGYQDGRR